MTPPTPSLNHVHLIGRLARDPQVEMSGSDRITTLALITMDDDGDRTHRVVVFDQMLVAPIFNSLVEGSSVHITGELDYDEKGCFVSARAKRGCDLKVLGAPAMAATQPAKPAERREVVSGQGGDPKSARETGVASQLAQPSTTATQPARTTPATPIPARPAPGQRPGGLSAIANAAANTVNPDDEQDDDRDHSSDEDAGQETSNPQPSVQPPPRPAAVTPGVAGARPGAPPPRPAPGGPRPAPAPAPQVNGAPRPVPPARPGSTRPGEPSPAVSRPTIPPAFADEIPF